MVTRTKQLRGREAESEALSELLVAARSGESRALVLHGEAGIGKTALIEDFLCAATDCQVLRTAGAESEKELAFAALQQLCAPVIERSDCLPAPQQAALGVAFGVREGPAPDRFVVGLAVLALLSEAAENCPLVCAVDDAQWLDRASAEVLAFVARRVHAEGIVLVFAMREPDKRFQGLQEIVVTGLAVNDAWELLATAFPWALEPSVRDRLIAEARGNPLALLELPRDPVTMGLAGTLAPAPRGTVSSLIEASFRHRIQDLPTDARLLMLIAAAEPLGDTTLLWDAAERCELTPEAGVAAEASGMISLDTRVIFRHPLVRSAVYSLAEPGERRRAHRALAEVTNQSDDPDRRAWHRAQAAVEPDDDIAEELHASAARAGARGGIAAAAAFRARAAALTRDRGRRGERALEAAELALSAGATTEVSELLSLCTSSSLDPLGRARVELLRARLAFAVNRARGDASALISAAALFESLDMPLARRTYLDALVAAVYSGRLGGATVEVARAALNGSPAPEPHTAIDLLLDGLTRMLVEGYTTGVPLLKRALQRARSDGLEGDDLHWLFVVAANTTWDYEAWIALTDRQIKFARGTGALSALPFALSLRMGAHLVGGEFSQALAVWDEITVLCDAMGVLPTPQRDAILAAWRGDEHDALEIMKTSTAKVLSSGDGLALTVIEWATASRYNGMGRYQEALQAAESAYAHAEDFRGPEWIHEIVEAAARSENMERARELARQVTEMTQACGTDWALGVQAYCQALVSDGSETENFYKTAIDRFERAGLAVLLARSHLVYGEWLRRATRRRTEARQELREAHDTFDRLGCTSLAVRAAREVAATGASVRKRSEPIHRGLTAQEAQVARLARDGHSNRMIGEQLFISPRTVEYHLHKVFAKLAITTRNQLHAALEEHGSSRLEATH